MRGVEGGREGADTSIELVLVLLLEFVPLWWTDEGAGRALA